MLRLEVDRKEASIKTTGLFGSRFRLGSAMDALKQGTSSKHVKPFGRTT